MGRLSFVRKEARTAYPGKCARSNKSCDDGKMLPEIEAELMKLAEIERLVSDQRRILLSKCGESSAPTSLVSAPSTSSEVSQGCGQGSTMEKLMQDSKSDLLKELKEELLKDILG